MPSEIQQPTPAPYQEGKRFCGRAHFSGPVRWLAPLLGGVGGGSVQPVNSPQPSLAALRFSSCSGVSLIECMVYIAVLGMLISIGGFTAAKAWDAHRAVSRNANDIHRAMNAGERWREEVRTAIGPLAVISAGSNIVCRIPTAARVIEYQLAEGTLQRREGADGAWLNVLPRVRSSAMNVVNRSGVTACRWELEMEPAHKRARQRPLFTFTAVPQEVAR